MSTVDGVTVALQNSDGTVSSAHQHELAIAAEMAKQPAWFGGGRFSGREGKMARVRQQEALAAAKLGLALPKVSLPPATALPSASATATTATKPSKKRKASIISANAPEPALSEPVSIVQVAKTLGKKKKSKRQQQKEAAAEAADTVAVEQSKGVEPVQQARKRVVVEPAYTAVGPAIPFLPTPALGWWGAKKFTSAGISLL